MSTTLSEVERRNVLHARDPATGEVIGSVTATPPEEIEEVVQAVAKVRPLWSLVRLSDRARYMRSMAQAVIDEFEELMQVLAREQGRPPAEIATLELLPAIDALLWIAEEGASGLAARGPRGRASMRLRREGGHARAGRQGRDARARRRAPAARSRRCTVGGMCGSGPGARFCRAHLCGAGALRALRRAARRGSTRTEGGRPGGPAHTGRSAGLGAQGGAHRSARRRGPGARGAPALRRTRTRRRLPRGLLLRAGGHHGGH